MEQKPLISVIMATFNEKPEYIKGAIQSILNQTFKNFELIVIDDSTNEATKKEIDLLASVDSRIVLIRKKERMGFVPALNEGLRIAKGDYIARMDGDDLSYPNRFEIQLKYMNSHPEVDILGGAIDIMNEDGKITSHRNYPLGGLSLKIYNIFRDPLAHPTVLIRKAELNDFQYDVSFKRGEDVDLWLRLRNQGAEIRNISNSVLKYRVFHDMSEKRDSFHFNFLFKARKKNFNWEYAIFDIPSIFISYIYSRMPSFLIKLAYRKENNKKV